MLVIICLLVAIACLDGALGFLDEGLSGNIRHIKEIEHLAGTAMESDQSVVFIGNSLTNNAISPDIIRSSLPTDTNQPLLVSKIVPDGTSLADWYCIYSNHLNHGRRNPELIIIGFAWAQLSDQYPINPSRLGGYFCQPGDIADLSHTTLSEHDNMLAFFAGAISHLYLNREAIRNRALDMVVPNYQQVTQTLNRAPGTQGNESNAQHEKTKYSYETLMEMSRKMHGNGTRLILVAMPVQNDYAIDSALIDAIRKEEIDFLDMRHLEGIDTAMFADSIHLNQNGQELFSHKLSQAIRAIVNENMHQDTPTG